MEEHWTDNFYLNNPQFYLDTASARITPERTAGEVDSLVRALELRQELPILDLACGNGRHAIELARRGYTQVTGLDYAPAFLEVAHRDAEAAGVAVRWVYDDMRTLTFKSEFSAVYSTLALFSFDDATNQAILNGVGQALRPGGRFLLQVLNPVGRHSYSQSRRWERVLAGGWFLEEWSYEPRSGQFTFEWTVIYPDGHHATQRGSFRGYTVPELEQMLDLAGLKLGALYGDTVDITALGPYTLDSSRLVAIAEKRE